MDLENGVSPDPAITAEVINDSKVLFEDRPHSLSPLTKEIYERKKGTSLAGAYQGASHWGWGGSRLTDIADLDQ